MYVKTILKPTVYLERRTFEDIFIAGRQSEIVGYVHHLQDG